MEQGSTWTWHSINPVSYSNPSRPVSLDSLSPEPVYYATATDPISSPSKLKNWEDDQFFLHGRIFHPFEKVNRSNPFTDVEKKIRNLSPIKFIADNMQNLKFNEILYHFYTARYLDLIKQGKVATTVLMDDSGSSQRYHTGRRRTLIDGFRVINYYYPEVSLREFLDRFLFKNDLSSSIDSDNRSLEYPTYRFKHRINGNELFYFFRCPDIRQYVFETRNQGPLILSKFSFIN